MAPPHTSEYQVAWISAIDLEYTIACAMLHEEYEAPDDLPDDDSCYTFGRIRDHLIVMARLPPERVGTSSAGVLATEIVRTFPSLKFGLLVGIAGGAPTAKFDVRLGDVVVSQPNNRQRTGGVIHYAFGRTVQDSGFERTGFQNAPPNILLSATAKLKFNHERNGVGIIEEIDASVDPLAGRLDDYKRPFTARDILYRSSVIHGDESVHCNDACSASPPDIIERSDRTGDASQPHVHYGVIGSADNLMRDARLRDEIAEKDGVLCFEMEAAGLMNTEPGYLVVRGICDYADTHKNDDWQKYAAATAAAYAKQLLAVIRPRRLTFQDNMFTASDRPQRKKTPSILELLSYESMNDKHDYALPEITFNHDWIWSTSFDRWLPDSSDPYWICGKPGSGKSTLMAYLAHNEQLLSRLGAQGVSYKILHFFYDCRAGSSLANNIDGMLRMLAYQLASHFVPIRKHLEELQRNGQFKIGTTEGLMSIACEAVNSSPARLCVLIDGLDEYEGDLFELMHTIRRLKEWTGVKLCVASRPDARVADVFQLYDTILMQDYNQASMREYFASQIARASSTKTDIASKFSTPVRDDLINRAEGIILWFKLALDELVLSYTPGLSPEALRTLIRDIPQGLEAMYRRTLGTILPKYRPEAALLLYLVQELRGLSQNIHELSDDGYLSTIDFSTTDMDHLWGAYDFIVSQIVDYVDIDRQHSRQDLQSRIKTLLGGLLEVYEIEPHKSLTVGTTNLDVRYIHKTLHTWLRKTDWIETNLPDQVKELYPKPFRLTFLSAVIKQASDDNLLTPENIAVCVSETQLMLKICGAGNALGSGILHAFLQSLFTRRSILLALYREYGLYSSANQGRMQALLDTIGDRLVDFASSDYTFPPQWKSRRVLLRTACLNILDLCHTCEKNDQSTFTSVSPGMKSLIAVVTAFHLFMFGGDPNIFDMITRLFSDTLEKAELREILDLALAIFKDLPGYLDDGLFASKELNATQKEHLVNHLLTTSFQPYRYKSIERLAKILSANECALNVKQLCFFMKNTQRLTLAAYHTRSLHHLLPITEESVGQHCDCKHESKAVGLLFHWAQLSSTINYDPTTEAESKKAHTQILELILECGIDINAKCYSGGNVLHAVLDPSVQPLSGREGLQRKAKFLALIEHGIDVGATGSQGTALEMIRALIKSASKKRYRVLPCFAPDLKDYDSIRAYLEFHKDNGSWPYQYTPEDESYDDYELAEDLPDGLTDEMLINMVERDSLSIHSTDVLDDQAQSNRHDSVESEETMVTLSPRPVDQLSILIPQGHDHTSPAESEYTRIEFLDEEAPGSPDDVHFFDARSSWPTNDVVSQDVTQTRSVAHDNLVVNPSSVVDLFDHEAPAIERASQVYGTTEAPTSENLYPMAEDLYPNESVESIGTTSSDRTIGHSIHANQLDNIWDDQATLFIADKQLIPPKLLKVFTNEQANLWLFVLQTLQTMGLEPDRHVKNSVTFVLQELQWSQTRPAILGVLRLQEREDLVSRLNDIEMLQLLPSLSWTTEVSGSITVAGNSHSSGVLEPESLRTVAENRHVSGASLEPELLQPLPEDNAQTSNQSLTALRSSQVPEDNAQTSSTSSPDLHSSQEPDHNGQTSSTSPPDLHSSQEPEESDNEPDLEKAILESIKSRLSGHSDSAKLSHRAYIDPAKRPNLKADPGAVKKKGFKKDQYDLLLVEDFRWVIIECLEYGQALAPSRRLSHQYLKEADWDFELAVLRCIRNINR